MSSILDTLSKRLEVINAATKPKVFSTPFKSIKQAHQIATTRFKGAGQLEEHTQYQIAQKFFKGDLHQNLKSFDLLSQVIHVKSEDLKESIFSSKAHLEQLLQVYQKRLNAQEDLQFVWLMLFRAYIEASSDAFDDPALFDQQLDTLRLFLLNTWPLVKENAPNIFYELRFIEKNLELFSRECWAAYSQLWLDGLEQRVITLALEMEIPNQSWFWEKLFIHSFQLAVNLSDDGFKKILPPLLDLLDNCPQYRDLGIQILLTRFARCTSKLMNTLTKDYVTKHWGSVFEQHQPNSVWRDLSKESLEMLQSWHHETNLRIFYALKTGDKEIAQQKLDFWLTYLSQIRGTKLSLGPVGQKMVQGQSSLQRLFSPSTNPFSKLLGDVNSEQNAILISFDQHLVIDFIVQEGCYIYEKNTHTFQIHQDTHYSTTYKGGLREKYGKLGVSIPDTQDWSDITSLHTMLVRDGVVQDL